jgi:hypothetical protein
LTPGVITSYSTFGTNKTVGFSADDDLSFVDKNHKIQGFSLFKKTVINK